MRNLEAVADICASPWARCVELTRRRGALNAAIMIVLKEEEGSKADPTLALAMMMFFNRVRNLKGYMKPNFGP